MVMRGAPLPDPEASAWRVFADHKSLSSYTAQCSDNFWQGWRVRNKVGAGSAIQNYVRITGPQWKIMPGSDPRSEGDPSEPEGPAPEAAARGRYRPATQGPEI